MSGVRESAYSCGCDAGANYHCDNFPHCAYAKTLQQRGRPVPSPDTFIDVARAHAVNPLPPGTLGPPRLPVMPPRLAAALPTDPIERKQYPVATGVLDYFPDAIAAVARVSYEGSKQHHPSKPLHWDRAKSTDQADTLMRHLMQRGTLDVDGMRHSAKTAWRALALLQLEIEAEGQ